MLDFSKYGEAKKVFEFFAEISKIPHTSGNTDKIADYLVKFANERGLYVRRDEANNVVIKKKATSGYENRPTVIIQGHTDMVSAVKDGAEIDMENDPLSLYIAGDFLRAEGTTLGGDDGVAVAYALALLDSKDISHPSLEAIFTSDEEIGLLGAVALDTKDINGRIMLNIDSDSEGIFTVGCAGGVRVDISLPMQLMHQGSQCKKITVSGLLGGHSGIEINKGRENAIKILAELLYSINEATRVKLSVIRGGNADNAIPRMAECILSVDSDIPLEKYIDKVTTKYNKTEPGICISVEDINTTSSLYSEDATAALISMLSKLPTGVINMSEDIEGLVETSLNLGIIECSEGGVSLAYSIRSSKGAEKEKLLTRVTKIAEEYGASYKTHGAYPAWEYKKESHLRDTMCAIYRNMYKSDASVVVIHAGLECGIFSDKLPGLDCVSIGPDNYDIHTTEERLSISSTIRVWEFIKEVLKNI